MPLSAFRHKQLNGFTLIELLVVISIIAILVATATVSWTNAQVKGRDSKRKTDLKSIQESLELYYLANGKYPPYNVGICTGIYIDCVGYCAFVTSGSYPYMKDQLVPTFLSKMPEDPTWKGEQLWNYIYVKTASGKYELYGKLENAKDPDYIAGGITIPGWCSGGVSAYTYRVISP